MIDAPSVLKKRYGKRNVRVEYLNGSQEIQQQGFPLDNLRHNRDFIKLL